MKTCAVQRCRYSFEEFAGHVQAMRTVREWTHTTRFGHLGSEQSHRANCARVLEYFFDCYADRAEALGKAELFLGIYDYLGRHAGLFARKGLLDEAEGSVLSVDSALLRAVHSAFSLAPEPGSLAPRRVLALARALQALQAV